MVDPHGEWADPFVPTVIGRFGEAVENFRAQEVGQLVKGALGKEA